MKKTEQQTYRLSEEEKEALAKIAAEMDMPAASIVGSLASRFVKARKTHGNRLIWPPEFNYYPASSKSAQDQATQTKAE
ncbi:MAG: hypothetical protein K9M54_02975 [Kiritimatiellales bacterium]|nr:hypothetical protein [Kiritimatiellales bacterium]